MARDDRILRAGTLDEGLSETGIAILATIRLDGDRGPMGRDSGDPGRDSPRGRRSGGPSVVTG